ncbi:MAG: cysteine dioxygenase [Zoogloeaceae bacterium]|jgi:predicted metal-dependent enzyme (double-stranded beta helix superfamily)|nr:cysteine dioxygenase [Zoogloeaceae bacterium]
MTQKLLTFVQDIARLLEQKPSESILLAEGKKLVATLVSSPEWLPEAFRKPHPAHYQQYLLYADPLDCLSIVSFVWGPGQTTPVHDHLTWGIVGGLVGEEREVTYRQRSDGGYSPSGEGVLRPGEVTAVSPTIGDVHSVANNLSDQVSISIHVYGANIGRVRRHVFDPQTGAARSFVSGYSNDMTPNLWSGVAA